MWALHRTIVESLTKVPSQDGAERLHCSVQNLNPMQLHSHDRCLSSDEPMTEICQQVSVAEQSLGAALVQDNA